MKSGVSPLASRIMPQFRFNRVLLLLVLFGHVALLAWSGKQHSPTFHELGHVPAGLCHWKHRMFHLYRVNPPLPRLVATFPLLFVDLKTDWTNYSMSPVSREVIPMGIRFVKANGERSFWLFTIARWACIPFSLVGAFVCFRWASDLWNENCGLAALIIWCFSPSILGHGAVVMPDVPAAAVGLVASYLFWTWLKNPVWPLAILAGITIGLACLCKTTMIVLFAVLPFLWLVQQRGQSILAVVQRFGMLLVVVAVSVLVINLGYGFDGSFKLLKSFQFQSTSLSGEPLQPEVPWPGNRFAHTWLANMPVPVPSEFLQGIDRQKADFELKSRSYLDGDWAPQGFWYYYLYATAVKVPLGLWLLFACAIGGTFLRWWPTAHWFDELCVLLPAVAILLLVSSQNGFSQHMRYAIPAFPFVFVWMSKAALAFGSRRTLMKYGVLILMTWFVSSSLWIYPHSISYFNETVGGPLNGDQHLLDSNIAWGQDLLYFRRWLDQHSTSTPVQLASYGWIDPQLAAIEFSVPPVGPNRPMNYVSGDARKIGPLPGQFVIDVNYLRGSHWQMANGDGGWVNVATDGMNYEYFQRFEPTDRIAYSMNVYNIDRAAANSERRRLGLPEI